MRKDILIGIFFLLVVVVVFRDLSQTFYQQDEWHTLGILKTEGISYLLSESTLKGMLLLENRPLARLTNYFLFGQFPLNIFPLFLFSVLLHTTNAFLIYKIASNFIKSYLWIILGTLFFIVNATSKQAVLWFGTTTGTLPAATLIFLSIFLYLKYLERKKALYLLSSIVALIASLGFKESGLFLFLFFPVTDFFYSLIKNKKLIISRFSLGVLIVGLLLFASKFLNVFFAATSSSRYLNTATSGSILKLVWAAITYPLESLSQIIFPAEVIFPLARKITEAVFPYFEPSGYAALISEQIVVEFISVLATIIFILPVIIFLFTHKDKWPIIFILSFYILTFVPFIILVKPNGYLESRYYYIPAAAVGILLGIFLENFTKFISKILRKKIIINIAYVLLIGTSFFYLYKNISFIQDQLNFLNERAGIQKYLLAQILKNHPQFLPKQVFYIESDHSFIVPNNPLPFQNGIGYSLLVAYVYRIDNPRLNPFLTDNYFWKLGSQGYVEYGQQGFGFFADKKMIREEIRMGKFNYSDITAFRFNSSQNIITDITREFQRELTKEIP